MLDNTERWAYLNLWAWWWTGPPKRRDWPWYICDIIWEFLAWFGLAANLTVIGSELPGGVCPFRCFTASSASALLSNRMKATPRDRPRQPIRLKVKCVRTEGLWLVTWLCDYRACGVTGGLVHQHSGVDDVSEASKHVLQVLLTQRPRQPADVQIRIFDHVRTRPRERNLRGGNRKCLSLSSSQPERIQINKNNQHWTKENKQLHPVFK